MSMTALQVIIYELIGMALCLLLFFKYIIKRHRLIIQCRNEASGEVVRIKAIQAAKENIYRYQPIVSFDTGSGIVQGPDAWDMKKDDFSIGDHVTVRYDPDNPNIFYILENHRAEFQIKVCLGTMLFVAVIIPVIYLVDKYL